MPNWVATVVNFEGNTEDINTIFNLIKGSEDCVFDFNTLVPMPDNIYTGNLGMAEREQYGKNNWYDWSIGNWGTKWNACNPNRYGNSLEFDTAWSFASPIMTALAELCGKHNVTFSGYFCDEDWGSDNKGTFNSFDDGTLNYEYYCSGDLKDEGVKEILVNCYGEECYEDMLDWSNEND